MDLSFLPTLNAFLNGTAAILLTSGWFAIRRGHVAFHRTCMLTAVGVSAVFLASYITYRFQVLVTPFNGQGFARVVYFTILIPHVTLAIGMLPMIFVVLRRALRGDFERHRRLARWTLPIWLYVSVTGVLVYMMLYVWFPQP